MSVLALQDDTLSRTGAHAGKDVRTAAAAGKGQSSSPTSAFALQDDTLSSTGAHAGREVRTAADAEKGPDSRRRLRVRMTHC